MIDEAPGRVKSRVYLHVQRVLASTTSPVKLPLDCRSAGHRNPPAGKERTGDGGMMSGVRAAAH
jgi:hypothetical protein